MKTVRIKAVTWSGEANRPFIEPEILGEHTIARIQPLDDEPPWDWFVTEVLCGASMAAGCGVRDDQVEDVTQDEIDAAVAYCALLELNR